MINRRSSITTSQLINDTLISHQSSTHEQVPAANVMVRCRHFGSRNIWLDAPGCSRLPKIARDCWRVRMSEGALWVRHECTQRGWREEPHCELVSVCPRGTRVWLQSDGGDLYATYITPYDVERERRETLSTVRKDLSPLFEQTVQHNAWRRVHLIRDNWGQGRGADCGTRSRERSRSRGAPRQK